MSQVNIQSWKVMLSMLNLHIDRRRNDTVLEQLVSEMRNYTNIHHLTKDTEMPKLLDFAKNYELSETEAQEIYDTLEKEKIIVKKGNKYFLIHFEIPSIFFDKINTILKVIELNGFIPSFKDLKISKVDAPESLLKILPDTQGKYLEFQRLYYGDEKPLIMTYLYYPLSKFKGLDKADLKNKQIWPYLIEKYGVILDHIKIRYRTAIIDKEMMSYLNTNTSLSNLLESTIFDKDNELCEYIINYTISDSFYVRLETKI